MSKSLAELLQKLQTTYPECGIVSTQPAWKWDFGTCVGNGVQGALAFARTRDEEIVLSHEEMFLPLFPFSGYLPVKEHFATLQQLVIDGKADEAQQLIHQLKVDHDFPRYNTTNPFVGAGSLDLLMPTSDAPEPSAYIRSVNFETAEALVAWQDVGGLFHRRFFFSRADDVLVIRISSPDNVKFSLTAGLREIEYTPPTAPNDHDIYAKTIDHCETSATDPTLTHRMLFKHRWEGQQILGSATVARVIQQGGKSQVEGTRLHITEADAVTLLIRTVPHRNGEALLTESVATDLERLAPDYDKLLAQHAKLHNDMFRRCRLSLNTTPVQQQRSGEEIQAGSDVGATDPALVEKTFAAGRFGIITSTGNLPPALQGVYTGTWKPRWSGDYTLNGNVQSMVAASLCGNHFECQQSLMDYLDTLFDDFCENARELLGFRGPLIPWRSSTHGKTHYLAFRNRHHNFPGVLWFAGAAWFTQIYYDYYLYTGDEAFFENRLKRWLLSSAELYEDYLNREQDGAYVLSPSSSPENENGSDIWIAPNATMTIAGIKQLMRTCLRHADKLNATPQQVEKWQSIIRKLPQYAVGANGALKEWTWPGIENEEAHRHASHLYPLYFGVDPDIAASAELQQACRIAIDERMKFRRPEKGGFMAFGLYQLGMPAAHLGDTPAAYECVECLVNSYWSPVLVSQHNANGCPDVLNLDISGGLPALIITMLVQSLMPEDPTQPWIIKLLPCLPDDWPSGSLTGVRCRGGLVVDIHWRESQLESIDIAAHLTANVQLIYNGRTLTLNMKQGEKQTLTANDINQPENA